MTFYCREKSRVSIVIELATDGKLAKGSNYIAAELCIDFTDEVYEFARPTTSQCVMSHRLSLHPSVESPIH